MVNLFFRNKEGHTSQGKYDRGDARESRCNETRDSPNPTINKIPKIKY